MGERSKKQTPGAARGSRRGTGDSPAQIANLSRLLFRDVKPATGVHCTPQDVAADFPGARKVSASALPKTAPRGRWDTLIPAARGVADQIDFAGTTELPSMMKSSSAELQPALCTQPTVTVAGSDCCGYTIRDQVNDIDVWYAQPGLVFADEATARAFVTSVRPSMPFVLPYQDDKVTPGQGWLYGSGSFHGAVDYGKSMDPVATGVDPAFAVHSIGDGTVLSVVWDDWNGNTVVIEHVAPNGDRYRSAYFHLRDGLDHDVKEAREIGTTGDEAAEYKKFADKANPDPLHWGTNEQAIKVSPGDKVSAGQHIGYSGNTGVGGANAGLDADGNPTDPKTANNHLHFMMTVPNPDTTQPNIWVQVDPYGVYSQATSAGCYNLLAETAGSRLFAPFYPSFHNVPAELVAHYWGYYTGMGMGLQTLSLHPKDGKMLASGSFQWGLPTNWKARLNMSGPEYQQWFDTYHGQGLRPRQIQVVIDGSGQPRFTVIWQERGNESYWAYHGVNDAEWANLWKQHIDKEHLRVDERVAFVVGGQALGAAVFVDDGNSDFYEWHNLTGAAFQTTFDDLKSKGYTLTSVNVLESSAGGSFGGVWRKMPGSWYTRHGISAAEYQTEFNNLSAQGYRLYRVQGYGNSNLFAAIWCKGA